MSVRVSRASSLLAAVLLCACASDHLAHSRLEVAAGDDDAGINSAFDAADASVSDAAMPDAAALGPGFGCFPTCQVSCGDHRHWLLQPGDHAICVCDEGFTQLGEECQDLSKSLLLAWEDVSPRPLAAGQSVVFSYRARSLLTTPAVFDLFPVLEGLKVAGEVLDDQGNVMDAAVLALAPGEERMFSLRLTLPHGAEGRPFMLAAALALHGEAVATSTFELFTIGADTEHVDDALALQYTGFVRSEAADRQSDVDMLHSVVTVEAGDTLRLEFALAFPTSAPGFATVSVLPGEHTTGWTLALAADTPERIVMGQRSAHIAVTVSPEADASPRGELVLEVRRETAPERVQRRILRLQRPSLLSL